MLGHKIEISEGVHLITREDNVRVVNIKNNVDPLILKKIITEHFVEIATISADVSDNTFEGLIDIRKLSILNGSKFTSNGLYKLQKIKSLYIDFPLQSQIDFENLIGLETLKIYENENIIGLGSLERLRYLKLYKISRSNLEIELPLNIEMLEVIEGKLETLNGLQKMKKLQGLMIAYQNKLTDFSAISTMEKIWFLHFMNCKSLIHLDFLSQMKNLRQVNFENCKFIESLSPLKYINSLKSARVTGNSKILDGDKSLTKIYNEKCFYSYPYLWK